MSLPFIIANLPAGPNPASDLDANFNAIAFNATNPTVASGTNAITLTPKSTGLNPVADIPSYMNNLVFGFAAAATSTGAVTIKLPGLAFLNAYRSDGVTGIVASDLLIGNWYTATYSSSLNSGAGGWYIGGAGLFAPANRGAFINLIRNPQFLIQQRGVAATTINDGVTAYTFDGWQAKPTGANAQWAGLNAGHVTPWALQLACTAAGLGIWTIDCRIESEVATLIAGQTIAVQIYVKGTGQANDFFLATRVPDVIDNWGASTQDLAAAVTTVAGGAWTQLTLIGTASANATRGYGIRLVITLSGNLGTILLSEADLRLGNAIAPPELPPYSTSFGWCQRFLQRYGIGLAAVVDDATHAVIAARFQPTMYTAPTLTLLTTTPAFRLATATATGVASTLGTTSITTAGAWGVISGFTGLTGGTAGEWTTTQVMQATCEL